MISKLKNGFDDATIERDDIAIINNLLKYPNNYQSSEKRTELETEFSNYIGIDYAFGFFKGRQAFSAIINSLNLKKNDEVILPGYTCIVVVNSIISSGLKPVFCDIELDTYGPDLKSIKSVFSDRTKVILIQHLYGLVCRDYSRILDFAQKHKCYAIDDCTQATGAIYNNKKVGYYSDAAFYSLQHSKVISCGDGGIATTNNEVIAKEIKSIQLKAKNVSTEIISNTLLATKRLYYFNKNKFLGKINYFYHKKMGWYTPDNIDANEVNGNMANYSLYKFPNSLAVLALNQLKKIDIINKNRLNNAKIWDDWIQSINLPTPFIVKDSNPIFLRYPIIMENESKELLFNTFGRDINVGYWFDDYLSSGSKRRQPASTLLPNATSAIKKIVNLPCL